MHTTLTSSTMLTLTKLVEWLFENESSKYMYLKTYNNKNSKELYIFYSNLNIKINQFAWLEQSVKVLLHVNLWYILYLPGVLYTRFPLTHALFHGESTRWKRLF